jgi:homocitrate synthase NifV
MAMAERLLARVRAFVLARKRPPENPELLNLLSDEEMARHV